MGSTLQWYTHSMEDTPEYSASQDLVGRPTSTGSGISPDELAGLQAVLQLTRTVVEKVTTHTRTHAHTTLSNIPLHPTLPSSPPYPPLLSTLPPSSPPSPPLLSTLPSLPPQDEVARTSLFENQSLSPIPLLFGLVTSCVPRQLKAQAFLTLAAFARSPEIAASLWIGLEQAQVVRTLPVTSTPKPQATPFGQQQGFTHQHLGAIGSIEVRIQPRLIMGCYYY